MKLGAWAMGCKHVPLCVGDKRLVAGRSSFVRTFFYYITQTNKTKNTRTYGLNFSISKNSMAHIYIYCIVFIYLCISMYVYCTVLYCTVYTVVYRAQTVNSEI